MRVNESPSRKPGEAEVERGHAGEPARPDGPRLIPMFDGEVFTFMPDLRERGAGTGLPTG
jgi:hypothetical protein